MNGPVSPRRDILRDWTRTDNAITDRDFHTQIFTSLPSQYVMILMVLKHRRPLPTPEEAMHKLREEETTTGLTKDLGEASMGATLHSQRGSYRGQGCCGRSWHGGRGGSGGSRDTHKSKYTYCKIDSHTTDVCRKRKCTQEGGSSRGNDKRICYQSRLPGHVKVDCVSYKCIKEWWRVMKATATAALATTRDCDPF